MKTVYIIYPQPGHFFEEHNFNVPRAENNIFWRTIREEIELAGYQCKVLNTVSKDFSDVAAILVMYEPYEQMWENVRYYPKEKCLFITTEPYFLNEYKHLYDPRMKEFFGTLFYPFDDLADNKTVFKIYHHCLGVKATDIPPFSQKKLLTLLATNFPPSHYMNNFSQTLYLERTKAAEFFNRINGFDLYGKEWPGGWSKGYFPQNKIHLLKNYKYCLAYENMKDSKGYITERIFDCLYGGCVPIYWGAANISDYVPKECFIDRRLFASNEELYQHLLQIDESTYNSYLEAAKTYLDSPQAKPFSIKNVAQQFVTRIGQICS